MTVNEYRNRIDAALAEYFTLGDEFPQARLAEAMRYSLLAGGKRIRPILPRFRRRPGGGPACGLRHRNAAYIQPDP